MPGADRTLLSRIRTLLTDGGFATGDRLPTERDLAATLEAPRSAVRRVLLQLEADGVVSRHVGRGTFLESTAGDARTGTGPAQIMAARLLIEPAICELAARVATPARLTELDRQVIGADAAQPFDLWERADAALHRGIAQACDNPVILMVYDVVHAARDLPVWGSLKRRVDTPERRSVYQGQHRAIVAALRDRDPESARSEMATHLRTVDDDLLRLR